MNENENFRKEFMEIILPPILLSILIGLSTFGRFATIIFTIISIPISLYLFDHHIYNNEQKKLQTNFFISWAISTFFIFLSVFEYIVVPFLEITIWENYSLLSLITIAVLMIIHLRKHSKHYHHPHDHHDHSIPILTTANNNNNNDHHDHHGHQRQISSIDDWHLYCYWIGCCIHGWISLRYYMAIHICLIGALLFNIYLNITTICHTYILYDFLLVPDDCSEVYFDINLSLSFIIAIYAGQLVILLSYSLLKLLILLWSLIINNNKTTNATNNSTIKLSSLNNNNNSRYNNCSYHLIHQ
ncbi:hypothetical protein DERP_012662 [Dermatophagoides pteronyssinus]|nr:hypothetical protein DERP_012662 [Dermatophagoides pteronyssinus]